MNTTEIKWRMIGKHVKDCDAVRARNEGFWKTEWACFEEILRLDKRGARKGYYEWMRISCNDPRCDAKILVRIDDILEIVSTPVKGKSK